MQDALLYFLTHALRSFSVCYVVDSPKTKHVLHCCADISSCNYRQGKPELWKAKCPWTVMACVRKA